MRAAAKLRAALETPSPRWLKFLRARGFTARKPFDGGRLEDLKKKLLGFGGIAAVFSSPDEEDLDAIMERGRLWRGYNAFVRRGEPCQCHRNACYVYAEDPTATRICTGYAMSRDGAWRQHSWCLDVRSGRPIETTTKRILYFGYAMNPDECRRFYYENC